MKVDWMFWVMYLPVVIGGFAGGWWIRGVKEADDRAHWSAMTREIERIKRDHPAYWDAFRGEG